MTYTTVEAKIRKPFIYAEGELNGSTPSEVEKLIEVEEKKLTEKGIIFQVQPKLKRGRGEGMHYYSIVQLVATSVDMIPAKEDIPNGYRLMNVGHLGASNYTVPKSM